MPIRTLQRSQPNINGFASEPSDAPLPPCSKRAPHRRIGHEGLHPARRHIDERTVVADRAMPEQSCEQRQRVV